MNGPDDENESGADTAERMQWEAQEEFNEWLEAVNWPREDDDGNEC